MTTHELINMTTILERLREETRPLHEQTEQLLYSDTLRGGVLSPEQYSHLLLTHLAYHQSLEQALDRHPDFFLEYEPDKRRKTAWLLSDLAQLDIPKQASTPNLFTDWSPVELLGATYVGEGSMLGGKTVWHYLQQSQELQPLLESARFYRGYGSDTGPNWRAFGTFVTKQAIGYEDLVVDAASRAFVVYQTLFGQVQLEIVGVDRMV